MFGIGNTIGAGVFALTGIAAQHAGIEYLYHNLLYRPISVPIFFDKWFYCSRNSFSLC